ncbi:MAG: TIGR03032 family protein [Alphaproteobacteria bacterium]
MSNTETAAETKGPILLAAPGFTAWLAEERLSVALTTYQAGRIILLGLRPDGTLRAHERLIEQCQGLWTNGTEIWVSGKTMLWRFVNAVPAGMMTQRGADRLFIPREGRVTGALDIHDIGLGIFGDMATPGPIFVATQYNCFATVSDRAAFRPLWRPPFVSALVPEDRCHLNGLAMDGGVPAYVTAVSASDVQDGWRDRRRDGGVVVHVESGEIVARGLSMPHSPRLHEGRLWVLNSGTGELGVVDPADGRFEAVAFLPGYARGLALMGRYAVVGLSRPRRNQTFEGLALEEALKTRDAAPRCGLVVVDIETGQTVQWLRFEHTIDELYDVALLPGVRQAEALGFQGDDLAGAIEPEVV